MDLISLKAVERIRWTQQQIKQGGTEDPNVMLQDFMILELMTWFKNSFFTWVNTPACDHCSKETTFSHLAEDSDDFPYTDRVELHKCLSCGKLTPFARYNDLNILLETRKGRCGEWANTFCLFCKAMGWSTRLVVDECDHVWVEIYSVAQRRWVHCDPCECVCDKPLMYEAGWGKKISYIMAYSGEEVQDVTWRYSSKHKEVLSRRTKCSEAELVNLLIKLRTERQQALTVYRRNYLTKRLLEELFDFLLERQPGSEETQGRTSGSLDWRLARGETQKTISNSSYIWIICEDHVFNDEAVIRYSASRDEYILDSTDGKIIEECWDSGIFGAENIFRKEELDWKTVYLSRTEGSETGKISWKFQTENDNFMLDAVILYIDYVTFENGHIDINVSPDKENITNFKSGTFCTVKLPPCTREVEVTATLTGGRGNVAWQHAQLFRQPLNSEDYPFIVRLKVKKKQS